MNRILVLSGGGIPAICVHTGALRAIDRYGHNFDIVIGTSAGAFIGALYSYMYSPEEIEKIVFHDINWAKLGFSDINPMFWKGFLRGTKFINMIRHYLLGRMMLRQLIAVACNLETGYYKLWHKDITPEKIFSSMAFPILFRPVEINGRQYGDGGITKNLGVEVVKRIAKKYDEIVAIDVISGEVSGKVNNILQYLFRIIDITRSEIKREDLEEVRGMIDYIPVRIDGCLLPDEDKMASYYEAGYSAVVDRFWLKITKQGG